MANSNKKETKTIFNTTEKSNFILNMTEEKYSDIASKALGITFLAVSAFTIPAELSGNVGYAITAGGLAVGGVICLILALIAIIKKYVNRKMLVPVVAFGAMLVWGVFSLINSYNNATSFYGFGGRGEGLLAIIFYFGFFLTGLTLKKEKALSSVITNIIYIGALNAIWGLAQIFLSVIPSNYRHIIGISKDVNAASGLAHSPIFLAMLLSLSLTAALLKIILDSDKKKRIYYIFYAALFSFVMIFTYSLVGVCGLAIAVITAITVVFATKAPKVRLASLAAVILPAAAAITLAATGVVGDNNSYNLYDGSIMWQDSFNRLSSSGRFDSDLDYENTAEVYSTINKETIEIIKKDVLFGTGPDQLVYPQLTSSVKIEENFGTFDKNYNEYLYTAATRGIPSLIALVVVLLMTVIIAAQGLKNGNSKNPTFIILFAMLIGGILIFLVGNSNIVFSPIFWAVAGASCADMKTVQTKSTKKSSKKNK